MKAEGRKGILIHPSSFQFHPFPLPLDTLPILTYITASSKVQSSAFRGGLRALELLDFEPLNPELFHHAVFQARHG